MSDKQVIFKKVTPETISQYRNFLLWQKRLSPYSVDRKLSSLKRFFSFLKKENCIDYDPFTQAYETKLQSQPSKDTSHPLDRFIQNSSALRGDSSNLVSRRSDSQPSTANVDRDIKGLLNRLLYYLRHTRPRWYHAYHRITLTHYIHFGIMVIILSSIGFGIYDQLFRNTSTPLAYPLGTTNISPSRTLSFQGKLTDKFKNPIISPTLVTFRLWNSPSGGANLYSTGKCIVKPDNNGFIKTLLGKRCGPPIPSRVFSENENVFLGITVADDEEMTPRHQIATAAYAANAATLQGHPPSASASANTIPVITENGDLVISTVNPRIYSTSGSFQLRGQTISIVTDTGTDGDVTIGPDGKGKVNLIFGGVSGKQVNATSANLGTGGVLYYGGVSNDSTSCKLLQLQSGAPVFTSTYLTDRFLIDCQGNAEIDNKLQVAGELSSAIAYSRLGNQQSSRGLSNPQDLLISGSLEVMNKAFFNHEAYFFGKVGIGTDTPGALLEINSSNRSITGKALAIFDHDEDQDLLTASSSGTPKFRVDYKGTIFAGNLETANTTAVCYRDTTYNGVTFKELTDCDGSASDLAEWYEGVKFKVSEEEKYPETADLVIVSQEKTNKIPAVTLTDKPYDGKIIGVVSTKPFQVMGEEMLKQATHPIQIALTGRVPIRVSTINGPINIGDPITSSSIPGVGMKATKPGSIVGKSLQDFNCSLPKLVLLRRTNAVVNGVTESNSGSRNLKTFKFLYDKLPNSSINEETAKQCDFENIEYWVDKNGNRLKNPKDYSEIKYPVSKIMAFVSISWHDPNIYVTTDGDIQIIADDKNAKEFVYDGVLGSNGQAKVKNQNYSLKYRGREIAEHIGLFTKATVANLTSGLIETKMLIAETASFTTANIENLTAQKVKTDKLVSPIVETEKIEAKDAKLAQIETGLIRPIPKEDVVIHLAAKEKKTVPEEKSTSSYFGRLLVRGIGGKEVASIDATGNATFAGQLLAKKIRTKEISANEMKARSATFSGKLYADDIVTRKGSFSGLLAEFRQGIKSSPSPSSPTPTQKVLPTISPTSKNVDNLTNDVTLPIDTDIIINNDLTVLGKISMGETYIYGPLLANGINLADRAINSFQDTLEIQKIASFPVKIMGGKVVINTDGDVTFNGNILAKGGLTTGLIRPIPEGDVVIDLISNNPDSTVHGVHSTTSKENLIQNSPGATVSTLSEIEGTNYNSPEMKKPEISSFGRLLVRGIGGKEVASIDASGNTNFTGKLTAQEVHTKNRISANTAQFSHLTIKPPNQEIATSSATIIAAAETETFIGIFAPAIQTNATAGQATLPAGKKDIIIFTPYVTDDSFVYLTPLSPTENKVLYVAGKSSTLGYIHIAVDNQIGHEVKFNWWIIN